MANKDKAIKITKFKIKKLFGFMNVDIPIVDNRIIITGFNGTGKTTILTMLFYVMRGKWEELSRFYFEEISLEIDSKPFAYKFSDIENYLFNSEPDIKILKERFFSDNPQELYELIFGTKNIPVLIGSLDNIINVKEAILEIRRTRKRPLSHPLRDALATYLDDYTVRFYPTFRRIEKDLNDIMDFSYGNQKIPPDLIKKDTFSLSYNMFGVQLLIDNLLALIKKLKKASSYITEESSKEDIKGFTIGELLYNNKNAMDYIKEAMKKDPNFPKFEFPEDALDNFVRTCNNYFLDTDKKIVFDTDEITLKILNEHAQEITLENLSFGEKQIISFFAELYLSNKDNFIIIIDEPELSLSIEWQKKFLSDIWNTGKCSFLMAVTHSPFVFENDLDEYAQDIENLCSVN